MKVKLLLLLSIITALNGCFLAPAIDSFNKLGVTASDRQNLLASRIQSFNDALFFGAPGEAEEFVIPDKRLELQRIIRRQRKEEKLVDMRVDAVGFESDAYKAIVDVVVRFYKVPFYVVNERVERQVWEFSVSSSWQLSQREEVKDGA